MVTPTTVRKRKSPSESPPAGVTYDSDEIVVSAPSENHSRLPLKELKNNSIGSSTSSTKRRRIFDHVLVTRQTDLAWPSSPSATSHDQIHNGPSILPATINKLDGTGFPSSPSPSILLGQASERTEATSENDRPRRSKARRSYIPPPLFFEDESEDELAADPPARAKREAFLDAASEVSDFELRAESSTSEHEDISDIETISDDDNFSIQNSDDVSDDENTSRNTAKNKSVAVHRKTALESKIPGTNATKPKTTRTRMINIMRKATGSEKGLDPSLPPLSNIGEIFVDIASKALDFGFDHVVKHLHNRPLRVATMCSGTESPLLALQMIQTAVKTKLGHEIPIEHLFSAEIVPFKQAYIDRNFKPRLIFRDITEFLNNMDDETPIATTAFGGKEALPMNPDVVVAGTSCVDVSGLNNHKKKFSDEGESGDTWNAVLTYCGKCRPSIVILENVRDAPWDKMIEDYEAVGYESTGVLVDTKDYYIPQTRQRGYMVCFNKESLRHGQITGAAAKWQELMKSFRRHASSPASSFLLTNDQIRAREDQHADDTTHEIPWERCKITQAAYRFNNRLGEARPLTNWNEDGSIVPPDFGSKSWYDRQVERVLDTMDVSLLRKAHPKNGAYDIRFKTRIVDLTQNVYYGEDPTPFGIVGCITPRAMHFISDSGRAMLPEESLMLQGLPLDKISFTTETPSQLQSLAGNAMTTTVVGSAIVSSLIASYGGLGRDFKSLDRQAHAEAVLSPLSLAHLANSKADSSIENIDVRRLLSKARMAMRRCYCEGSDGVATAPIQRCEDCGHTSCATCGGNPKHNYRQIPELSDERVQPGVFESELRSMLPLWIKLPAIDKKTASVLRGKADKSGWVKRYFDLLTSVANQTFTISTFKRTHCLTLCYEANNARLELVIDDDAVRWRLFIRPPTELVGNDDLRRELASPVAVSVVSPDSLALFSSAWSWRVPAGDRLSVSIKGNGTKQPSWLARLQLPDYLDTIQWESFTISISGTADRSLKQSIEGTYHYRPQCGTANENLYVKCQNASPDGKQIYLFLDPNRLGEPKDDCFVFATSVSRLEYNQTRPIIARLPSWRPWDQHEAQVNAVLETADAWIQDSYARQLQPVNTELNVAAPEDLEALSTSGRCDTATAIFSFDIPAGPSESPRESLISLDDNVFFSKYSWAFEALRRHQLFDQWHEFDNSCSQTQCLDCAPPKPQMKWKLDQKGKDIVSYPDPVDATRYERALKQRSEPVIIEARSAQSNTTRISLGINFLSLAHRAFSRLPKGTKDVRFAWKICAASSSAKPGPRFRLKSTQSMRPDERDLKSPLKLFPLQKTSLAWMRHQESAEGHSCTVEESEEASIPHLGFRIEMRAIGHIHARAGICADHPGFGKTVTTLALIQSRFLEANPSQIIADLEINQHGASKGLLPSSATLIIQPRSLLEQWMDEIHDKLDYRKGVYSISTTMELAKLKVEDIQNAKIICLSSTVLASETYNDRFGAFVGLPSPSSLNGRAFKEWLAAAARAIPEHIRIRQQRGLAGLRKAATAKYQDFVNDESLIATVPSRRLRGENYISAGKRKPTVERTKVVHSDSHPEIDHVGMPFLQMFYWDRIVVDEFHDYKPEQLEALRSLKADKRWGLSGTPAMEDAYDVSRTASLLGITLRTGSDTRGNMKVKNINRLREGMSPAELFDAMRHKHSQSVENRIRDIGQGFLDSFVRRNVEKFEQIGCEEYIVPVRLTLAHRAIYAELQQDSISKAMRLQKKSLSKGNDRDRRISELLSTSYSTEEALAKLATFGEPECSETSEHPPTLPKNLERLISIREEERNRDLKALRPLVSDAQALEPLTFHDWNQSRLVFNGLGDPGVLTLVEELCDAAKAASSTKGDGLTRNQESTGGVTAKGDSKMEGSRQLTSQVNTLACRLVVTERSLRFLKNALTMQQGKLSNCNNPRCTAPTLAAMRLAVSANCGHTVCASCHEKMTIDGTTCAVDGCSALMRDYNLLWKEQLVGLRNSSLSPYGAKVEAVVDILRDIKQRNEQAILFVQYKDQLNEVKSALQHHSITAIVVTDLNRAGQQIKDFRESAKSSSEQKKRTVLVLNQSDETAAGFNIQNANHVIFLGPLLRETQYEYDATMAQAVGRVRRHGQTKKLHLYRIVALHTIDVDILEHRECRRSAVSERGMSDVKRPESLVSQGKEKDAEPEHTQLVCESGKFSLRPKSWLVKCGANEREEGLERGFQDNSRVLGWESFSSEIKFSKVYVENDR